MTIVFTNHLQTLKARYLRQQDACLALARKIAYGQHGGDPGQQQSELRERFEALKSTRDKLRAAKKAGGELQRGRP